MFWNAMWTSIWFLDSHVVIISVAGIDIRLFYRPEMKQHFSWIFVYQEGYASISKTTICVLMWICAILSERNKLLIILARNHKKTFLFWKTNKILNKNEWITIYDILCLQWPKKRRSIQGRYYSVGMVSRYKFVFLKKAFERNPSQNNMNSLPPAFTAPNHC